MSMNNEELNRYIKMAKEGNSFARNIIIKECESTVRHIIYKYIGESYAKILYDDLMQVGRIRINKCINDYDESICTFRAYFYKRVMGAQQQYIRDYGLPYRIRRSNKELIPKIYKLEEKYGRKLTSIELSKILNCNIKLIEETMLCMRYISTESKSNKNMEDSGTIEQMLVSDELNLEDEIVNEDMINSFLDHLDNSEQRFIVIMLLKGYEQKDIAKMLDMRTYTVCRIVKKIRNKYLDFSY